MPDSRRDPDPSSAPPISVVICAYTPERLPSMREAVAALEAGTIAPAQIVIAIDHSPEVLASARELWPAHTVVENDGPRGLSGARNSGVAAATAAVVAFLDDDAVPDPDWVERLGEAYADPAVLGVGGTVRPRWVEGEPRWFPPEFAWVVGCTHSGMPEERRAVRNVIGANMSFRRANLVEVGGFRTEFGRVGKDTAGAEETDLCIRIGARHPEGEIVFEPRAAVEHIVPGARSNVGYFLRRCRGEGRSKAVLARLVGAGDGLSDERAYVRRTLPLGVLHGLRRLAGGELGGLERSAMIVAGLLTTTYGYASAPRPAKTEELEAVIEDERLRVLMVTPRSPLLQGGVERHVMEVSKRIAAAGEEVEVLCTDPGGPALAVEHRDGVEIRAARARPANRDWCLAPRLWPEIRRAYPDVVHVQSYHTLVAPLAMLRALVLRVPYVVTFHGGGHSLAHRNRARRLQRRLLRPLLARAARLVAVASFEIEEYGTELGLPPDRFVLIPNGTDLSFSANGAAAPEPREGPPLIATIGRLERYKGHQAAIAALPEIRRRIPDARLLVIGTGPYEAELREQAAQLGLGESVEFTSTPPDRPEAMAELMRRISVVVLMSEFETHPLVALEAAAAGCRLVVADASGLGELAAQGLARPVPPTAAPAEVAAAVEAELARTELPPRPDLSSWDDCARSLLELYRSVTEN
ncbi:MAG: glycosyltransferase [Actinobacteria bacterium]|nr:glycosyltransferase [Actinomycetota bacterium]